MTSLKEKEITMRTNLSLFLFVLILASGCINHDVEESIIPCNCDNPTNQIDEANSMIIGEWSWISTAYPIRGSETIFETPQNTNNQINYIFTTDSMTILKNGANVYKAKYSIRYLGGSSNSQTDILVIEYSYSNTSGGESMLYLDKKCMSLINSANDAGGNVLLARK